MYSILRSFLFLFPAEKAHHIAMNSFKALCSIGLFRKLIRSMFSYEDEKLYVTRLGLHFSNPVGIAAGFDKDARYIRELDILGFGFIEVGTVTPLPQKGNPSPRLFRLKKDKALINRMGFNNGGVDQMIKRLQRLQKRNIIIGGNIGKNKITPLEEAHMDYLKCFIKLNPYVDYFVINVSSPNTPGLRSLQDKTPLLKIINTLIEARKEEDLKKPILLKIAPDLTDGQLKDIGDIINSTELDGLIVANTTIDRSELLTSVEILNCIGNGGLSGVPVKEKSNKILSTMGDNVKRDITFVGVGGIDDGQSAHSKIKNGAHLIQLYTGFIYQGPFLVKKIKKHLVANLASI